MCVTNNECCVMCAFKYCKGPEACFLRDISPCPGAMKPDLSLSEKAANIDKPGPRNRGFVDRNELAAALGLNGEADPLRAQLRHIRVTSKLERAVELMEQTKAS